MSTPLRLAVFSASPRANNNGGGIAKWAEAQLRGVAPASAFITSITPTTAPHPLGPLTSPIAPLAMPYIGGKRQSDGTVVWPYVDLKELEWSKVVQNLDGLVIVTPEYNNCIPGDMKNVMDHIYPEWENMPIAVINYGGQRGGAGCAEQFNALLKGIKADNIAQGKIQIFLPFNEYVVGMKRTDGSDEFLNKYEEQVKEVLGRFVQAAEKRQAFHVENKKKYDEGEREVKLSF